MPRSAEPSSSSITIPARGLDLFRRVGWDLSWIIVGVGVIAAISRLVAHDAHLPLIWANSFSAYLYAPAMLILPLAVWRRRRLLALASALLVCAHVVWVWPDFLSTGSVTASDKATDGLTLRVFSANLYYNNPDFQGILGEIRNADPDVILLQEYSASWHRAFQGAELIDQYPHQVFQVRDDSFGIAVYSKQPLLKKDIWEVGEVPMIAVCLLIGQREIRILNWHPLPPRSIGYVEVWRTQYDQLLKRLANNDQPLLIVGDFNATQHADYMAQLADQGFRSAHEETGRGLAVTYPNGTSFVPPIRLDHALMSRHWHAVRIHEGVGRGSDHKPLIAEFVLAE